MIRQVLGEGPAIASDVIKMVTDGSGCSHGTVTDAAKKIGVLTTRQQDGTGKTTGWLWQLPPTSTSVSGPAWTPETPETEVIWHGEDQ
jgi:hypothetical protein